MRKAMICSLLVLCSLAALGQSQPRWTVVLAKSMGGKTPISNAVLFIPKKTGLYRLSAYISASGPVDQSGWVLEFIWNDLIGGSAGAVAGASAGQYGPSQQIVVVFSPQKGVPVTLNVEASGDQSSSYHASFTVEQLQSD
jgi:hypothetical protein